MTTNKPKERPILFSGPMVRAILDGRKTQTRRIVKPQPSSGWSPESPPVLGHIASPHPKRGRFGLFVKRGVGTDFPETDLIPCPYGRPGDRLWVRETWNARPVLEVDSGMYEAWEPYEAIPKQQPSNAWVYFEADGDEEGPWRPSIHMPRWASRKTLEITSVRVERLQDISGMDAKREGVSVPAHLPHDGADLDYARREYRRLWQSINGPGSWDANPWVWVIEFKRAENKA